MLKRLHIFGLISGAVLALFPEFAFSQMMDDTIKIEEVAIYFQRDISEAAMNNIEIDSLTKSHYSMSVLSDLLASTSSINIRDYGPGSISTVSMRGTGSSHTVVLWNGINLNSPLTGQADFSLIPVGFTDKIVVKPGASSLQDMSGGLGGCVNLENQSGFEKGLGAKLGQEFASFSSNSGFAGLKWGGEKWFFAHRFTYTKAENDFPFWRNIPLGKEKVKQENAAIDQYGFLQEIYYRPNDKDLISLIVWLDNTDREIPPLKNYEGRHDEHQQDISTRAVLKWQAYRKHFSWHIQSAIVNKDLDYQLYHHPNVYSAVGDELPLGENIVAADATNSSTSFLNQLAFTFSKKKNFKLNFKLDVDQHRAEVENKVSQIGFVKHRNELSAFVGVYQRVGPKLMLVLMARNNILDGGDYHFAPLLGFEYKLHENRDWSLKGNVARNFRYASMNDLYYIPGGNPDLKAEKGISEELNLNARENLVGQKMELNLSAYSSQISDWILWTPTQFGWWTPENKEKVLSRGIETTLRVTGLLAQIDYTLNVGLSLSSTTNESDGDTKEEKGEQLIYVPRQSAHFDVSLRNRGYSFHYAIDYTGLRHTSYGSNNSYYDLPAYILHSISVGKNVKLKNTSAGISFQVNNLFNVDYESIRQRAMPGRNYAVKLNMEI